MRKLETKKEKKKKEKRNQLIVGAVLIIVMIGSVFGIITTGFNGNSSSGEEKISYNGYDFFSEDGYWTLQIGDLKYSFLSNPLEIENLVNPKINGSLKPLGNYYGSPLYVSSEDSSSEIEIYRNMGQVAERFQKACVESQDCEESLPIKDCSNNFIIIKQGNETQISQENNCVFITGKKSDLIKITDDFLLRIMEIK